MANNHFEWIRPEEDTSQQQKTLDAPKKQDVVTKFLKENKVLIGLLVFILSVGVISSVGKKKMVKEVAPPPPITAYVSMWPVKKGDKIDPSLLKAISLSTSGLTKTQKLRLFDAEQFNVSSLRIIAKKDVAPNTPLFWNELELSQDSEPSSQQPSQIFYGISPERTQ